MAIDIGKFFSRAFTIPGWWKDRHASPEVIKEFQDQLQPKQPTPPAAPKEPGKPPPPKWFDSSGRGVWLSKAMSYIGTHEAAGDRDNPVILNWAKGVGGDTAREYTHDSIPWCKLFIIATLQQVGLKYDDSLWALDSLNWGTRLAGPAVGALAVMKRDGGGHVTWVVGRDQHGNVMCCGGNQSDAVNIKPFDPDRVVGWRWPSEVAMPSDVGMDTLPAVSSDGKVSRDEA